MRAVRQPTRGRGDLVPSCVALVALAFLPTVWAVGAGLFVLGAGYGSWDVAMNVQASQVDRHAGRDLMPRYHGCWSVGAFVGAALGTLAAAAGVPLAVHLTTAAGMVAVGVTVALRWFLADPTADRAFGDQRRTGRPHAFITRTLVLIGVVTLCATCIEGRRRTGSRCTCTTVGGPTQASPRPVTRSSRLRWRPRGSAGRR